MLTRSWERRLKRTCRPCPRSSSAWTQTIFRRSAFEQLLPSTQLHARIQVSAWPGALGIIILALFQVVLPARALTRRRGGGRHMIGLSLLTVRASRLGRRFRTATPAKAKLRSRLILALALPR
jgi:hypothetical protein